MKYYKLQELCIDIIDCPHSTPNWKNEGIRVIRNFNLKDGNIDFIDGYFVDEATYIERTKRAVPEEGDIIISREAPMGVVGIVPKGLKCCLGQRLVLLKVNKQKCDPFYLLNTLMSDFVQTQFRRADATGSIVSNLCIPDLKEIIIPVIEHGQREVASFFEMINRKRTINNMINDNLSAMAYDIYMHTFFPKKPNAKLKDILTEAEKSAIQVGEAKTSNGKYPFFTSGATILKWNEPFVDGRNCFLNTGGNADVKFYVGKAAYSTDTWSISAKSEMSDYLYLMLFSIKPELDQKFFQGTGLKHLQKPLLKNRPIYVPEKMELEAFNRQVMPMFDIISENTRENQQLTSLRDWLLPMLMNGQATISD
ncbi:Type I restriction modification DNA specificity domain [uncultured Coprococcus sp.]|uniref:restriction endonuclease subunit S n=1 Tax=Coprococcus ammoniilyticus TaxID=2981785 RepID=UPI00082221C7|nr:restriction endonuclease subunit S [Coprococcus ammoniilyticus]MCU6729985.1 restriction endonuclease subunit S [Coprococcus ammoniilyticus]SCH14467.1 Type I restriction modification DNA specificity domain [uncultured Coprococcus sp.]